MSSQEVERAGSFGSLERTILNSVLLLALIVPHVFPFVQPLSVTTATRDAYELIDHLPAGSIVLYDQGGMLDSWQLFGDGVVAMISHVFSRDLKLVIVGAGNPQGPIVAEMVLSRVPPELLANKKYGVDYIHLGFVPGEEAAVSTLATDFKDVFVKDVRGNAVSDLPLWGEIKDLRSFALVINQPYSEQHRHYMRHWVQPHKIPLVLVVSSAVVPAVNPFYASGQVAGFVGGVRGAAEYELLLRRPAGASGELASLSVGVAVILGCIVVSNVLRTHKQRRAGK